MIKPMKIDRSELIRGPEVDEAVRVLRDHGWRRNIAIDCGELLETPLDPRTERAREVFAHWALASGLTHVVGPR